MCAAVWVGGLIQLLGLWRLARRHAEVDALWSERVADSRGFLVQVTHTTMGALAGVLAAARWLELRLAPPARRVAEAVAGAALLAIALVLVFYREANFAIPPG